MIIEMQYFITAPGRTDLYWRANRCGYTTNLAEAGLYSGNEALGIEKGGRGDKAIPFIYKGEELKDLKEKCVKDLKRLDTMLDMLGLL